MRPSREQQFRIKEAKARKRFRGEYGLQKNCGTATNKGKGEINMSKALHLENIAKAQAEIEAKGGRWRARKNASEIPLYGGGGVDQ